MAGRKRASSSSLFLMELILAILLFCIAATICISIFARSHLLHRDSMELNNSISTVQNTAELIRSCDSKKDIVNLLKEQYPKANIPDSLTEDIVIYLNQDFISSDVSGHTYVMTVEPNTEGRLFTSDIILLKDVDTVEDGAIPIYELYIEHTLSKEQ